MIFQIWAKTLVAFIDPASFDKFFNQTKWKYFEYHESFSREMFQRLKMLRIDTK